MTTTQLYSHRDGALAACTSLSLDRVDLLALPLQAGDRLRSEHGTVWITVDGQPQDILLAPGQTHVVPEAGAVNVSALGSACVQVRSAAPLAWRRVSPRARPDWVQRAWSSLAALGHRARAGGFYNPGSAATAAGR